jgi:ABC-type uncharacterized transport system permease subunit
MRTTIYPCIRTNDFIATVLGHRTRACGGFRNSRHVASDTVWRVGLIAAIVVIALAGVAWIVFVLPMYTD